MQESFIYIMTNKYRTTFYIGVTSDLSRRIIDHQTGQKSKFAKKYNIWDLVYFEVFTNIKEAIAREKQLKNWKHEWKVNLIKEKNPTLETLYF
ncbi:GIY-YIG nuclease family protein [Flagellimonas sp. HMM57]|uniref:GIY-YIG nuclease family protein n=1 Tax=unclassified Flagellimonas TaxID=2644544 RepID=UPI0013D5A809|nr:MULTISPECIES: GIY-YIG nuclease family protein [unclassified Flagellimonas]UII75912.1 GIY-YIG nuclease family protein [Flagellimonas sp. HMM57]